MFIKLNENNEIVACANFKVDNTFVETDKKVVSNFEGKLVYETELNEVEEENNKNQNKIWELKEKISNEIYEEYSLSKQIDIIGRIGNYTDQDFESMKNFINKKINEYKIEKNELKNKG